ncbi:GNAT family N-acetyltransferase [Kribbella shirazensis]|uniref:GNAT superfamily N-acetyltransferase n=1 Tax=Kribbella shirazensis TaxID=1105143 RepID=A0A7X6A495_9ACTN|nr:GNAT family N-acetyltransferase [Kribbella shirazensis]NIK61221.1 GNAT superfamily N-acetyltransferase [Kribbella shirazensis]
MEIRAAGPGDVDAAVALHDAMVPYLVVTRGMLVRRLGTPVVPGRGTFAALDHGELVGWATTGLIGGSVPLDGELRVIVRPEYRRRGIGTRLLEATHANLRAAGATTARVFADPRAVGWAARFGYRQTRQVHYAGIDPRKVPPQPEAPSAVHLVPLSDVDPHLLYAADMVAQRTKPGDAKISSRPYDEWLAAVWNSQDTVLDLSMAAIHQGEVVAFTLGLGDHTKIWSKMTSTMPQYRGRGLAKLVKAAALHRAADAGVEGAYTANYDGNTPMLAVNEWLGYHRIATHAVLICPL